MVLHLGINISFSLRPVKSIIVGSLLWYISLILNPANNDNDLVSSCFEYVSNNANSILGNKIAYFREKYRIQHDFSNLNKAIKMIEQASVLSGEEKSLIDSVWSLILVKSNQYTVEGFDFAEINDMLCFLVTS